MTLHDKENARENTSENSPEIARISSFALSEDWLAVVVGLLILILALVGIITEDWLLL